MTPDLAHLPAPAPAGWRPSTIGVIEGRAWWTVHPVVGDLVLASTVAVVPLVVQATGPRSLDASLDAADVVVSVVAFALIMARRRAPLVVLGVSLAAAVVAMLPDDGHVVLEIVACIVLYTVASTSTRRIAWIAGATTAVVLYVTAVPTSGAPWYDGDNLEEIAWAVIATALGDAVRSRRAYTLAREERATALRERAERAEQALEEEGRRQVVEERLRIARELHDVVAHHIAVINVQAGVASHLLRNDPEGAGEALAHVRRGVTGVLDEFAGILSVLRRPDEPDALTEPLPTLDQLDQLVASFSNVGLEVDWRTSGARRPVEPSVALTAYRIVQEALTNAHRHGRTPRARLRVDYLADGLAIDVVNDATIDDVANGRGHGLVGMRERVAAVGGTIDIGTTGTDDFRVHAVLPTSGEAL